MECNGFDINKICYFAPKKIVWPVHIIVGLTFITLFALFMVYKDKQDQDSINLKNRVTESTFYILFVLGLLMFVYHGHLGSTYAYINR
jgi:CHASE1-domain containing sensor protein